MVVRKYRERKGSVAEIKRNMEWCGRPQYRSEIASNAGTGMGLRRKAYMQRSVRSALEGKDIGPRRRERSLRNAAVELQREVVMACRIVV
jgi:hypothetical protein